MEILLTLVFLTLTLSPTQTGGQDSPALQVLILEVQEKPTKRYNDPTMVSNTPPDVHPTLGRGDEERTDPPNVTSLEETRKDTDRRKRNMDALANKKAELGSRSDLKLIYESRAQIKNNSSQSIVRFIWAYKASPSLQYNRDQEFLCAVNIRPGATNVIKASSDIPHRNLIDASASNSVKPSLKDVVINYVEFSDGTIWRRFDWHPTSNSTLRYGPESRFVKGRCIALM